MIDNLRIGLFVWGWEKWVVEKPVNPMDGLRVECGKIGSTITFFLNA